MHEIKEYCKTILSLIKVAGKSELYEKFLSDYKDKNLDYLNKEHALIKSTISYKSSFWNLNTFAIGFVLGMLNILIENQSTKLLYAFFASIFFLVLYKVKDTLDVEINTIKICIIEDLRNKIS